MPACARETTPFASVCALLLVGVLVGTACTFPGYSIENGVGSAGTTSAGQATGGAAGAAGGTGGAPALGGAAGGGSGGDAGSGGTGPMPSCSDELMNGDETDVDCGGSCLKCPPIPCDELVQGPELSEVVGADALVAWYRFVDAEGMGADASGAGNHALSADNVVQVGDEQRGCVAAFEGDGELALPPLATTNATFALWLRTEVNGRGSPGEAWHVGSGLLDAERAGTANDFGLCLVAGQAAFGVGNPDATITGTTDLTDGVWHHVAATRDDGSGAMLLYVDGLVEAQGTGATGARDAVTGIYTARGRLVGDVADVRIYQRVLSADEISSILNGH